MPSLLSAVTLHFQAVSRQEIRTESAEQKETKAFENQIKNKNIGAGRYFCVTAISSQPADPNANNNNPL